MMKNEDTFRSFTSVICGCLIKADGLIVDKYTQTESHYLSGHTTHQDIYQQLLDDDVAFYYI